MSSIVKMLSSSKREYSLVLLWNMIVNTIIIFPWLNNEVISGSVPSAIDAEGYYERAKVLLESGFSASFESGFKMPGYSILIAIFIKTFHENALLALRLFQLILVSVSSIILYSVVSNKTQIKFRLFLGMIFPFFPNWYFIPLLIAESITASLFTMFFALLFNPRLNENRKHLYLSVIIVVAIYFKPNNIILLVPLLVWSWLASNGKKTKAVRALSVLSIVGTGLSPWLFYLNNVYGKFVGLTTNLGGNLYIGTGMVLDYNNSVLSKAAVSCGVDPAVNPEDVFSSVAGLSPLESSELLESRAAEIWRKRTPKQVCFGIRKVFISFGFDSNNPQEYMLGIVSLLTLIFTFIACYNRLLRTHAISNLSMILVISIQAFVFQADRRFTLPFVTPSFFIFASFVLSKLHIIKRFVQISRH